MPYQIKNGIIYSGNAVTLTQAQYDALTTAEKNNGTVYYIYDSDAMIEAQEVGLDGGNVEDLAGSVATIEASPATANHEVGEYILWNGVLYTVTSAIATGENLVVNSNISATTVGEELTALNNGLTSIKTLDDFIGYKDRTVSNISIDSDNGYASLGDVYTNWGLPSGAYVLGFYVRGWSSAPGTFSLASSSDGRSLYTYCTKAGTIGYLSIRVWYAKF